MRLRLYQQQQTMTRHPEVPEPGEGLQGCTATQVGCCRLVHLNYRSRVYPRSGAVALRGSLCSRLRVTVHESISDAAGTRHDPTAVGDHADRASLCNLYTEATSFPSNFYAEPAMSLDA